ncbi:hypothetical protein SAY87_002344 [Trapa incisa]|uniref:Uncharacterized protein n=1 Tax=Trapa incisa TaxID=236973 RepID=A0AAN7JWT9_9MYRT|nr:hypothetical protein SAY87_002344 [Trapa incisa]
MAELRKGNSRMVGHESFTQPVVGLATCKGVRKFEGVLLERVKWFGGGGAERGNDEEEGAEKQDSHRTFLWVREGGFKWEIFDYRKKESSVAPNAVSLDLTCHRQLTAMVEVSL